MRRAADFAETSVQRRLRPGRHCSILERVFVRDPTLERMNLRTCRFEGTFFITGTVFEDEAELQPQQVPGDSDPRDGLPPPRPVHARSLPAGSLVRRDEIRGRRAVRSRADRGAGTVRGVSHSEERRCSGARPSWACPLLRCALRARDDLPGRAVRRMDRSFARSHVRLLATARTAAGGNARLRRSDLRATDPDRGQRPAAGAGAGRLPARR